MTNREAYERDCEELDQYRKIGTVEECRKAVIEQVKRYRDINFSNNFGARYALSYVISLINNQPIEFDKEKVIEELQKYAEEAREYWKDAMMRTFLAGH